MVYMVTFTFTINIPPMLASIYHTYGSYGFVNLRQFNRCVTASVEPNTPGFLARRDHRVEHRQHCLRVKPPGRCNATLGRCDDAKMQQAPTKICESRVGSSKPYRNSLVSEQIEID